MVKPAFAVQNRHLLPRCQLRVAGHSTFWEGLACRTNVQTSCLQCFVDHPYLRIAESLLPQQRTKRGKATIVCSVGRQK